MVPALENSTPVMPAAAAACSATRSAMGERQMFPRQTKTTRRRESVGRSATSRVVRVGQEDIQDKANDRDDQAVQHCCPETFDMPSEYYKACDSKREQQQDGIDH